MSECWDDLAVSNREAAVMLRQNCAFRSAISRAYYAVYALVTARLQEMGFSFAHDREGPTHASIPSLIEQNLKRISARNRRELVKSFMALYNARIQADYWPSASIGLADARQSLQRAHFIFRHLGGGK